jgi:hypothetical protein
MEDLWLKETMELLGDLQNQRTALDDKIEQLHEELFELDDRIAAGHSLVRAYIEKHNLAPLPLDINPGYLASMSYPDMLVEIAKAREGYLKVTDAVEILLKANVGRDKRSIQANVYSALRREKQKFVRIAPGQYRYSNHAKKGKTKPSGVRQAVRELKEKNPQMTKGDILNHLIQTGFDFKGKQPKRAVHMAWVSLGYPKEEKQSKVRLLTLDEARKLQDVNR